MNKICETCDTRNRLKSRQNERVLQTMIKLDLEMPKNTFECPFLEEDSDNTLWCYFAPQVEKQCTGLFKGDCPIIKYDTERKDKV